MSNWYEPILFGLALISFVLGLTSIIMGALPQPDDTNEVQAKVEYSFFGISGLAVFAVFLYALCSA